MLHLGYVCTRLNYVYDVLRLCKMRVLKFNVKNEALFEVWKQGKWEQSIITLWGIIIYVEHIRKQWKSCSPLRQTYKLTIISN